MITDRGSPVEEDIEVMESSSGVESTSGEEGSPENVATLSSDEGNEIGSTSSNSDE